MMIVVVVWFRLCCRFRSAAPQQQDVQTFLETLTDSYLSTGLQASAQLYRNTATSQLNVYADWLVGMTVASIVALLVFYVFGYRPAILQMDKDMRRTRSMLLVFPDEVRAVCWSGLPCLCFSCHGRVLT